MTPAARVASAIDILDQILAGTPAEKTLTTWARANRYAGSGDRAAIRDHVYDALRCRSSFASLGGAQTGGEQTGRGLMIGAIRAADGPLDQLFSGTGYGPAPLSEQEAGFVVPDEQPEHIALDCPEWLVPMLKSSLGPDFEAAMGLMQSRAPLFLRTNLRIGTRDQALAALGDGDIAAQPDDLSPTAIKVTHNPRRVQTSDAYRDGLVEIQDAASQAIVDQLPLKDGDYVLDYCAGGGGKSLAMAALADVFVTAHDENFQRMRDIPARAERANVSIARTRSEQDLADAQFDLVLCDAPCSGSGAWRRSPDAKWSLTPDRLKELQSLQLEILSKAQTYVAPGGTLAYATCSLLAEENSQSVQAFVQQAPEWQIQSDFSLTPLDGGDGFYLALLTRA